MAARRGAGCRRQREGPSGTAGAHSLDRRGAAATVRRAVRLTRVALAAVVSLSSIRGTRTTTNFD